MTLRDSKRILFNDILRQFGDKYSNNPTFKSKIDDWVASHSIDKTRICIDDNKHDKIFRDRINQALGLSAKIDRNWEDKYTKGQLFHRD